MAARTVPFLLYALFLLMGQAVGWLEQATGWLTLSGDTIYLWLYPIRTLVVAAVLVWFWRQYDELPWPPNLSVQSRILTIAVGVLVYMAWVRMDWSWATHGTPSSGDNLFAVHSPTSYLLAAIRLCGATIVVPVMEELFWRSFVLRYLISSRFETIPIGTFRPFSFIAVVALFGVEHDLWLAGIMAGVAYGLLLVQTQNLWTCVGAHAIATFVLRIHVLVTKEWSWWRQSVLSSAQV